MSEGDVPSFFEINNSPARNSDSRITLMRMVRRIAYIAVELAAAIAQIIFLSYALSKVFEIIWQDFKTRRENQGSKSQRRCLLATKTGFAAGALWNSSRPD